jgi:hypothetical protein
MVNVGSPGVTGAPVPERDRRSQGGRLPKAPF